jgi:transmembrane secretion effector
VSARRVRRVAADFTPLRASRDFRLLFLGQAGSLAGSQLTLVAVPLQAYLMTRSSLVVGLVGLVELGPLLVGSLLGGAAADAVDRRRLLLGAQVGMAAVSVGLALNASLAAPSLGLLMALAGLGAGLSGVDITIRRAVVPVLVPRELIPATAALNAVMVRSAQVVGPALAGLVIAGVSLEAAYWLDVGTYGFAIAAVLAMRPIPPAGGGTPMGLRSLREGIAFLRGQPVIAGAFLVDLNAMVFGMPRALFPALGTGVFGGTASVGFLYAAPAAGALLAAVSSGWVGRVRRQGRAVLVSIAVWGAAIAAFGLVPWLPLALLLLAVAGAADIVSEIFRSTIVQLLVPDRLRGRLSSLFVAQVTGSPRLGDVEAGAVAAATSPQISAVTGGLACIAGLALIAWRWPALGRFQAPAEAPPAAPDSGAAGRSAVGG